MFFDDELLPGKRQARLKTLPPIPDTGWKMPTEFPNLSAATLIGIDVETFEPDFDRGPGWSRGKGHIVGFSISAEDRVGNKGAWYFPVRHEVEPEFNLDPVPTFKWAKHVLKTSTPKCGANLLYDLGWLTEEGIFVEGDLHDVQFAEALLNEDGEVNLDYLGFKYLDEGKAGNQLYEWCALAYGGDAGPKQRENIWRSSPRLVGKYGEQDADMPLRIIKRQWPLMEVEGLLDIYRMECDLIPLLIRMRRQGIRANIPGAERLYGELRVDIQRLYGELAHISGVKIETVGSPQQLAKVFDAAGIKYPRTEKGNPSFRKEWLAAQHNPIANLIKDIREYDKIRSTFIRSYLLESHVNGVIHGQFHPLRGDSEGTRSGRFSSNCPNLQNIPSRTELGKRVRKLFVPFNGHIAYGKRDYSQIEYRFLSHYAVGQGSDELRATYIRDPKTDYHRKVQGDVENVTGKLIERKPIKALNFGLLYGQGKDLLCAVNNFTPSQGEEVFTAYHTGAPYVKATMKAAADEAAMLGYITTILGRRSRFNMWEPSTWREKGAPRSRALPYEDALRQYGSRIKRADLHKAINRRLQGSAADQMKTAMRDAHRAGVFDVIGVPLLTVHDELGHSVIDESQAQNEAYAELDRIMENCIPLKIPVIVDAKNGPSWGEID